MQLTGQDWHNMLIVWICCAIVAIGAAGIVLGCSSTTAGLTTDQVIQSHIDADTEGGER